MGRSGVCPVMIHSRKLRSASTSICIVGARVEVRQQASSRTVVALIIIQLSPFKLGLSNRCVFVTLELMNVL
jgi:hypothetical protein